jgi:choline dehydrogenase-like flavoprotein
MLDEHFDAIIIGSGAGGSTLAYQLARAGLKTLLLERGGRLRPNNQGAAVGRFLYHEVKENGAALSFVGGATKFYGAALYRFRESDFTEVVHENGVSPAWPIRYADLAPYYDLAEALYRVHGASDGDITEPPRAAPYPYPPLPQHVLIERLSQRLRATGTGTAPIPRGLNYGAGGNCVMCATCDAHYCQLDAKLDAETAALAQALATGNLQLETGVECLRVLTEPDGRKAAGVLLRRAGEEYMLRCPTVVVSAGLPGSAALLRRSRTTRHPEGLGNAGGALGRYLGGHAVGMVFPFMGLRRMQAAHTKDFAINTYYHGAPGWEFPLGVIQTGGQTPFWEMAGRLKRPLVEFVGRRTITCFYMAEALPTRHSGFAFAGDSLGEKTLPVYNMESFQKLRALAIAAFRKAGYPALARTHSPYLWHETGTARMGEDAGASVVDANCQVHGVAGLYVVDASVLPSAGAVNTGLTIMALALRAGDHIAGRAARRHASTAMTQPA